MRPSDPGVRERPVPLHRLDQPQQPRHTGIIRSATSIARLAQLLALTGTPLIRVGDEGLQKDGRVALARKAFRRGAL